MARATSCAGNSMLNSLLGIIEALMEKASKSHNFLSGNVLGNESMIRGKKKSTKFRSSCAFKMDKSSFLHLLENSLGTLIVKICSLK